MGQATADTIPLPLLINVPEKDRVELVEKKLRLCSVVHDFRVPTMLQEKELKRQTLLELVDYISVEEPQLFTEMLLPVALEMVSSNICRTLPPHTPNIMERDDEEPILDPAWPHLQIVYEFFLRIIVAPQFDSKTAKKNLSKKFIVRLIELFDSEDPRERDYLKTITHRIYGKGMSLRSFIRKTFNNVFFRFMYEEESFNGIGELLEILGSIINGFTVPLKPEHIAFLDKTLIPLHRTRHLPIYHGQLCYCVTQFVEKEAVMAVPLVQGLLRYWPRTDSSKEVLFLNELDEVVEQIQPTEFAKVLHPLFVRLALCIGSSQFQVTQRSLSMWNSEYLVSLVATQRSAVLPLLFGPLQLAYQEHWNGAVQAQAYNVLKLFMDMDAQLFHKCAEEYKEKSDRVANRRVQAAQRWTLVERMAKVGMGADLQQLQQQQQYDDAHGGPDPAASTDASNGSA